MCFLQAGSVSQRCHRIDITISIRNLYRRHCLANRYGAQETAGYIPARSECDLDLVALHSRSLAQADRKSDATQKSATVLRPMCLWEIALFSGHCRRGLAGSHVKTLHLAIRLGLCFKVGFHKKIKWLSLTLKWFRNVQEMSNACIFK